MLHYHHCLIQIFNELFLGEGFLVDFQAMSIDKHGDGFIINGSDQN